MNFVRKEMNNCTVQLHTISIQQIKLNSFKKVTMKDYDERE